MLIGRVVKKQEEFEEKLKFKNQFKPLDEDDVEYLVGAVCYSGAAGWGLSSGWVGGRIRS